MLGKLKQKTYFYYDHLLKVHEIKWFRLKLSGAIAGAIILAVALLLTVNHVCNNFLGLGNNRLQALTKENELLQSQLAALTSHVGDLEGTLKKLASQGDQLRLLVDLHTLDGGAKAAGTGGEAIDPIFNVGFDPTSRSLDETMQMLRHLSAEVKVQEQSYDQIVRKSEYNKGFFAALPALKPMEGFYEANDFGMRLHPVLGIMRLHEGIDIVGDVGTPVYATGDGTVEMAGHSGGGYGIVVVIKHGYGYQTLYGHLSKVLVREGQHIKRGDRIALSGRTGLVSGPHLHYEVRLNGVSQNPVDYFFDDVPIQKYQKELASR